MSPLLLAALSAASPRLLPDRAAVLPRCTTDPADGCWEIATEMHRFVPPDGLTGPAVDAAVQLAWQDGGLLVRADALPAGATVEISLSAPGGRSPVWSVRVEEGLTAHDLPEADGGQLRQLWVSLLIPDGAGFRPHPWSPTGTTSSSAFPALLAASPPLDFPVSVSDGLLIAPGADAVTLTHLTVDIPRRSRGVPPPWSTTGSGALPLEVPHTGWYRAEAVWREGEAVVGLGAWRVYLEAPEVALSVGDIFPAPAWSEAGSGGGLTLTDRTAVCLTEPDWQPAADLLIAEVARLSGRTLTQKRRCRSTDIRITRGSAASLPVAALPHAEQPESFTLRIAEGAEVGAWDLRGAVYGALALADALGTDGIASALTAVDAPAIADRILYQQLNLTSRGPLSVETWTDFLQQVVARGRYNQLYLNLLDSFPFSDDLALRGRNALTAGQLSEMIAAAEALGIAVYPAVSAPGHATWITRSRPELASGGQPGLLCPRHPDVYPLLQAAYEEILAGFGEPERVHIGHDETFWDPTRTFGDERDPYCAGVPAWVLFADDLRWHVDFFERQDAAAMAWSDMLVEGWNGGREDTWRAAEAADLQEQLTLAAWSKVGDSEGTLGGLGYPVVRLHTGYHDWKREGLDPATAAGEGLALFHPFPWMAAGVNPGTQPLRFYWTQVLLAGATAWRPDLTATPIAESLAAINGLPAMMPGWQHPAGWSGRTSPLLVSGTAPDTGLPAVAWPDRVGVGGVTFTNLRPLAVTADAPARITVDREVVGVSLLQAAVLERDARQHLVGQTRGAETAPALATLTVTWIDGETAAVPIALGRDTLDLVGDVRAISLWGVPGVALPSPEAAQSAGDGTDRQLYRLDWHNSRPNTAVRTIEVTAADGATVIIGGAVGLDPQ